MKPPVTHEEVHLRDYLYILKKRRFVIVFFTLLVLSAGIAFTYMENVVYKATTTILIERENPNVVDFKEVMAVDGSSSDYYQTQYQMLQSRTLIERLIREENLENDSYLAGARKGKMRLLLRKYQQYLPEWFEGFLSNRSLADIFIAGMLRIDPSRNSRLVKVSIIHPDPEQAALLSNRLIELFIQRNLEDRFLMSKRATRLLQNQLLELKEKVAVTERILQEYKEKEGLINIPSIHEKDAFLQEAKLELVKMQAEEAMLSKRYLPAHPKMISIQSQVEGLQEKIDEQEAKTLNLSRVAIEYSELERESETARKIYESLLSRFEETQSEAHTQASNVLVVDPATPPSRPYKPRPMLNVLVALFVGIVGGILLAFFFEYLDPTVRIPEDIEKALGLDVIGIIPRVGRSWRKGGQAKGELMVSGNSPTTASESFRALRTALLFKLRSTQGCRVILVTSANPSEGKSTVSLNLAAAFQQNNLRVLLVDGDLRKPRLNKVFDVDQNNGLSDILENSASPESVIRKNINNIGFDFLSCGTHSHRPTEILGSDAMTQTLESLKESYDIVIIDTPPFHAVADVNVINDYAHCSLVVARYHKTHRRHLRDVKKMLGHDPKRILGVVINDVSVREKDYYYHRYYYYGYGDAGKKK